MTAPHRMDLMVSAMTKADGGWNCNLQCRHCYAAGQPEAEGKITKILLLGAALAEATAIYGFVIALLIIILLS